MIISFSFMTFTLDSRVILISEDWSYCCFFFSSSDTIWRLKCHKSKLLSDIWWEVGLIESKWMHHSTKLSLLNAIDLCPEMSGQLNWIILSYIVHVSGIKSTNYLSLITIHKVAGAKWSESHQVPPTYRLWMKTLL